MNLDGFLLDDLLLDEKVGNVAALISLELDDGSERFVLNDGAVAAEDALECLEEFLKVEFGVEALDGGQALPSVSLLDANVNVVGSFCGVSQVRVSLIERIE